MSNFKRLDIHVSFTLIVPERAATKELRVAIKGTLEALFNNSPSVRVRDVVVGEPHDPKRG